MMKSLQLKTSIDMDTTLNFPVWYGNGTKEAMLMHVMVTLDVMKKCGHFKAYNEDQAQAAYVEQTEAVKLAKASLSLLDGASKGSGKSRKYLKKAGKPRGRPRKPRVQPRRPTTL
jgi:hypothetical protein